MLRPARLNVKRLVSAKAIVLGAVMLMSALLPAGRDLRVSAADATQPIQAAPGCRNTQLVVRAQSSLGAAGTIEVIYRIHNISGRRCTLFGYPGVQLLDRHFITLPTTVHRGGSVVGTIPRRLVHVSAYGNAYFALAYSDVPVGNRPCEAMAFYLMIWAPNDVLPTVTHALTHNGGIEACTGTIHVSPVTARARYR